MPQKGPGAFAYELAWEPSVDDAEIGVSVENGALVILNGTVKSRTRSGRPNEWPSESKE